MILKDLVNSENSEKLAIQRVSLLDDKDRDYALRKHMDYNNKLNMKNIKNIQEEYTMLKKIGSGAFGTVHTATRKHGDDKVYAVKVIDKKKVVLKNKYALSHMTKEIETLQ